MLQHGSYTLLIDACYDREQFPTLEEAIEWTWASTTEETEAVTFVLRKFFTLEGDVYVQNRVREEIEAYHGKAETNKRIAEDRERNKREASTSGAKTPTNRARVVNEAPPNQEPLTINHKPKEKKSASALTIPGVDDDLMADFLKIRKAKKAPLTKTAIAGIKREADKAGLTMTEAITACVECNWQGFNAGWYAERLATKGAPKPARPVESFAERDQAKKRQDWEEMTGRKWPESSAKTNLVIDEIKEIGPRGMIA